MLEQRDLELIGQIVKVEVDVVRSDLRDFEDTLSNRMDNLEKSQGDLVKSIKDTEHLLIDEIGKTQIYLERKFEKEINDFKSENQREHELIMTYYRSSRNEQATIDSMQESIFDLYHRVESLEGQDLA